MKKSPRLFRRGFYILYRKAGFDMPLMRGHHLICLHFFRGQGYDEVFIKNLGLTLARAKKTMVAVTSGADDVCAGCVHLKQGSCRYADNAEEEIQEMDAKALKLLGIPPGVRITWDELKRRIPSIFPEWFRLYCADCSWRTACEKDEIFQGLRNHN